MKKNSVYVIALLALVFCFSLTCSPEGTSKVTITIDLGTHNKSASNAPESSIIDRVLRFFAKNAEAAPPSHINSITLNVTGDGMDTITKSYASPSIPDTITLEIPAGDSRTFELLAYTASATLRGVTTRNLTSGATVTIPIQMGVYETKIIFPNPDIDGGSPSIIQLDSIDDSVVEYIVYADLTSVLSTVFRPWDIDYDNQGRIYFANNGYSSYDPYVIRIHDFTNINPERISQDPVNVGIKCVAIDRSRNNLYFSNGSNLQRVDLSTATFPDSGTSVNLSNISGTPAIIALSVDDTGMLYIADSQSGSHQVLKLNPNDGAIINSYSTNINFDLNVSGPTYTYGALKINNNNLYIANFGGADNYILLQLNLNLSLITNYGIRYTTPPDTTRGVFYGPHFFCGIRNDKFYILDEIGEGGSAYDKLIAMDDMNGTNWTVNESFSFFFDC
ncbi:MAG: hypothetical protein JXN64_07240 [Spirochaetes bacterium]|nr:hypothetical protein [Spirochaetota bacterium]